MSENERLDKMTVPRLREVAKELGVAGTTAMKKDELIHAIVAIKPELAPADHKPGKKIVVGKVARDIPTLKKGRGDLKKKIAEALAAKDGKTAKALRQQKKHARRLIKRARLAGLFKTEEPAKKEGETPQTA